MVLATSPDWADRVISGVDGFCVVGSAIGGLSSIPAVPFSYGVTGNTHDYPCHRLVTLIEWNHAAT
jgi:hypothetical protein